MLFFFRKFYLMPLSLAILLLLTGCGQNNDSASPPQNLISVNLLGIIDSSGTKKRKPYPVAIVKLAISRMGSSDITPLDITPEPSGTISAEIPLLLGEDYNISASAYANADGTEPVRYKGNLQTGVIQPDTVQLTIHMAPASPGSTISINDTYTATLSSYGATLAANITSSSNYTVAYFEWRSENSEYTKTRIKNLGTSEVSSTVSETLTELQNDTTYFFRATAVTSDGTVFGPEVSFRTNPATALLSWSPPTTNADGTPLYDLKGYRVYHRDPSGNTTVYDILNSQLPSQSTTVRYTLTSLALGTHFFSVTAYDFSGNESTRSQELSKTFM